MRVSLALTAPIGPRGAITTRAFQFGSAPGVTTRALFEDNPLVQQLNVQPSEFKQHQFTTRLDGRLTKSNTLSGTFFFSNFPALDSFPGSVEPDFAVYPAPRRSESDACDFRSARLWTDADQ